MEFSLDSVPYMIFGVTKARLDGNARIMPLSRRGVVRPSPTTERIKRLVRFENVGTRYSGGREVLRGVSFRLKPGSFHFLIGPSGAGKTSLLRLIFAAEIPSRGRITIFDQDTATATRNTLARLRRRIGVVFQDFRLLDHLSAFDNVALPLRIAGERESDFREHVMELLQWVGVGPLASLPPESFSCGEKRRLAVARAVVARPSLLLADEPTSSVDHAMEFRLMRLFEALNNIGTTVLIATRKESLAAQFGHPRLSLVSGRVGAVE